MITAELTADTSLVVTVKDPVVEPKGTVMLLTVGAATAALFDESVTTMGPGAALHSSVTVSNLFTNVRIGSRWRRHTSKSFRV